LFCNRCWHLALTSASDFLVKKKQRYCACSLQMLKTVLPVFLVCNTSRPMDFKKNVVPYSALFPDTTNFSDDQFEIFTAGVYLTYIIMISDIHDWHGSGWSCYTLLARGLLLYQFGKCYNSETCLNSETGFQIRILQVSEFGNYTNNHIPGATYRDRIFVCFSIVKYRIQSKCSPSHFKIVRVICTQSTITTFPCTLPSTYFTY
jgi:hypothetical protein